MRWFLSATLLALFTLLAACSQTTPPAATPTTNAQSITVYKSPTWGCCGDWIAHLQEAGFTVEAIDQENLAPIKTHYQVPSELQSCHTAIVDGYVVEGHVPAEDIRRLLTERPAIIGLAVPDMPIGSPGMEIEGIAAEPYDVIAFTANGAGAVYASYR